MTEVNKDLEGKIKGLSKKELKAFSRIIPKISPHLTSAIFQLCKEICNSSIKIIKIEDRMILMDQKMTDIQQKLSNPK
jgi:hypothetical protein